MSERHPLPYAYAKQHVMLLERGLDTLQLWISSRTSPQALSEVQRMHRPTALFTQDADSLSERIAVACASVSLEKRCGTSYLRTAISISMPGSSMSPSTSVTRPTGCEYMDGGSVSSTATTCPAAPLAVILTSSISTERDLRATRTAPCSAPTPACWSSSP